LARRKLAHFAEMDQMPFVFAYPEDKAGRWAEFFGNQHPIILEVGCGTGRYTTGLAQKFPENNYIGLDIKGSRMWHGAKAVEAAQLKNAAFIRTQLESIQNYFAPGEVDEIWITFPDPQPRESRERKRLSSPRFLALYKDICKPGGIVHLKTDNQTLFDYSVTAWKEYGMRISACTNNLYAQPLENEVLSIKTTYEERYLAQGLPICYMRAQFP
jgi:tRNA (guanine-N7-)-methyltransferase